MPQKGKPTPKRKHWSRRKASPTKERKAHVWAKHPEEWYCEPEWCDRRLFEQIEFFRDVLDPACGIGRILQAARVQGIDAIGTDIVKRCKDAAVLDFFAPIYAKFWATKGKPHIVCNPPFSKAEDFARRALEITGGDATLLLPITWLCGDTRSRWLEQSTLKHVLFMTPRPSMPPGPYIMAGEVPGQGWADFAWFLFRRGHHGPPTFGWLRRDR